ncbi:MAG: hypothetical protein K9G48_13520 [Reyranella sp.]|nr:hypothetical protein [Reyranella sp.]
MDALFFIHLAIVPLAALVLWTMRHEFNEKAVTRFQWALPPLFAVVVAAMLLIVSPGKRFELWVLAILVGLAAGAIMGLTLKLNQDFAFGLMRVPRTWDGLAAGALLLLLALVRFVSSELIERRSGKFGVLGAAAAFLAAYLVARYVVTRFYKAPRAIHLDMHQGRNPGRTLVH